MPVPPTPGPSEFAFSIDCYTGPDPAQVFIGLGFDQSNDPTGLLLASARANPVGTCDAQKVTFAQGSVYGETIADRLVNGSDQCLVMNMTGAGPEYAWIFAGEQHVPFREKQPATSDLKGYASGASKPAGFPADCQQVTVPKPTVDTPPLAACTVDVQHVSVYLLGTQTTEQVCQSHGYDVWAG